MRHIIPFTVGPEPWAEAADSLGKRQDSTVCSLVPRHVVIWGHLHGDED
jgi:hypothetical protein